eukprot:5991912-Pleurochrysis_carterae.AAC.2
MVRHRDVVEQDGEDSGSLDRVVTCHSYSPPVRLNASRRRPLCGVGGERLALTSAKRHSVEEDSRSELTGSRESLKLSTLFTSLSAIYTSRPASFKAVSGRYSKSDSRATLGTSVYARDTDTARMRHVD